MKIRHYLILFFLSSSAIFLPLSLVAAETIQADLNNDGIQDLKAFFNSDTLTRTELDRNGDGQADAWMLFAAPQGRDWDTRADYDENYDGQVDQIFFIKGDTPVRSFNDGDQDGMLEEEVDYKEGAPEGKKQLDPPLDPKNL